VVVAVMAGRRRAEHDAGGGGNHRPELVVRAVEPQERQGAGRTNVLERYNALWTQIAAALRDESPKLAFESVNEPQFTGASAAQAAQLLNELNTSFHRVRPAGVNLRRWTPTIPLI
jgi:hypothetical protein